MTEEEMRRLASRAARAEEVDVSGRVAGFCMLAAIGLVLLGGYLWPAHGSPPDKPWKLIVASVLLVSAALLVPMVIVAVRVSRADSAMRDLREARRVDLRVAYPPVSCAPERAWLERM